MPLRKNLLVNNEIYHVINRGTGSIPIFNTPRDYNIFLQLISYYQYSNQKIKFTRFNTLPLKVRDKYLTNLKLNNDLLVEIITYCLMPNHFHFLIKQLKDNGIENFIRHITNSHSHFFNKKYSRKGSLFEGRFKAIRIENDNQLLHVSRYIHLNPYSSFLVKDIHSLSNYPYSSFPEYKCNKKAVCKKDIILSQFKSIEEFNKYTYDQSNYQRTLDQIKHQLME